MDTISQVLMWAVILLGAYIGYHMSRVSYEQDKGILFCFIMSALVGSAVTLLMVASVWFIAAVIALLTHGPTPLFIDPLTYSLEVFVGVVVAGHVIVGALKSTSRV